MNRFYLFISIFFIHFIGFAQISISIVQGSSTNPCLTDSEQASVKISVTADVPGNTIKYREDSILLDPRNKNLGARLIINLEKLYLSLKKLELKDSPADEYYKLSHNLGIPQKDMNDLQNKLFGIECNFEELNGIDFKKGCYVGQENTARIKLKNKLSKRLLPIDLIEGELNKDDVIYNKNYEIGKVLLHNKYPFALIKFRDVNLSENIDFNTKDASIKIEKPNWIKSN